MNAVNKSPDNSDSISIEELDFSKYRTKELASRIGDLLSLPKTLLQLVATVIVCLATVSYTHLTLPTNREV